MKITLFIPTLNEIKGLKSIMPRIKKEWVDEIIIFDGNSTDGSREYCVEKGYTVIDQKKPGPRNIYWEGFPYISGDVVILFSPDNNSIPELIPELIAKMEEGNDMVIVSRYKDDAKSYDDTLMTTLANTILTGLINLLFRAKFTDCLVIYRAFKRDLLDIVLKTETNSEMFEILSCIECSKKLKYAEIPGDEPDRIGGEPSRSMPSQAAKLQRGWLFFVTIMKEYLKMKFIRS